MEAGLAVGVQVRNGRVLVVVVVVVVVVEEGAVKVQV